MRNSIHGDLSFLHRFEQRGLGLWCSAIDFVRKDDLPHDGSRTEFEFTFLLIEDRNARHVAGEHVGRKLNAIERAIERFGEAAREHGLAHAGHVFDEQMSLTQQADDDEFQCLSLAHDHVLEIADEFLAEGFEVGHERGAFPVLEVVLPPRLYGYSMAWASEFHPLCGGVLNDVTARAGG